MDSNSRAYCNKLDKRPTDGVTGQMKRKHQFVQVRFDKKVFLNEQYNQKSNNNVRLISYFFNVRLLGALIFRKCDQI